MAALEAAEAARQKAAQEAAAINELPAAKRRKVGEATADQAEEELPPEYRGIDPDAIERIKSEILDAELNVRFSDIGARPES